MADGFPFRGRMKGDSLSAPYELTQRIGQLAGRNVYNSRELQFVLSFSDWSFIHPRLKTSFDF